MTVVTAHAGGPAGSAAITRLARETDVVAVVLDRALPDRPWSSPQSEPLDAFVERAQEHAGATFGWSCPPAPSSLGAVAGASAPSDGGTVR
ncbi:MAG TPA: hypothetical protein VG674_19940 [Amycolatopsis sp.]|nr:hypothetical protein [Amycolatopsis sp.]